jgi:hypothetical protein
VKIQRLIGWFLIVLAIAQVFIAMHGQATAGHRTSTPFVFVISLMCTAGAVLLWRGAQEKSKT